MRDLRLTVGAALVAAVALTTTPVAALAATFKVNPGDSIQAAVDLADDGDTVMVYPGTYIEPAVSGPAVTVHKGIRLKGKPNKKTGDKVVLLAAPGQTDGVLVEPANPGDPNVDGFRISGFTVQGFQNNGIHLRYCDNFRIEKNESIDNEENGIFPTLSANGLVKRNVSYGSDDSALWVEASTNVRVMQNDISGSPTGLEITISQDIEMTKNDIHDNTTGVGFYHPSAAGLPMVPGMVIGNWVFENNHVHDNNAPNTAPPGSMPASLPPGGGVLVLGADFVTVDKNVIENNDFYGITAIDYCLAVAGGDFDCGVNPPAVESEVNGGHFGDNELNGNGLNPDPLHPLSAYAADITYLTLTDNLNNRFCGNTSTTTLTKQIPFGHPIQESGKCT